MKVRIIVLALALGGCDAILDFDKLRDGHGDGGVERTFDFAGEDLTGVDLSGTVPPDMSMSELGKDGGSSLACKPTPGGPFYQLDTPDELALPAAAYAIAVADLNHDGLVDIVYNDADGMVNVMLQTAARAFANPTQMANGCAAGNAQAIFLGDFDSDGIIDLVVPCNDLGNSDVTAVAFLKGQTGGSFADAKALSMPPTNSTAGVAVDLDHDGALDVVLVNQEPAGLVVYWGGTGFVAGKPFALSFGVNGEMAGVAAAPLGGKDAYPDLVVAVSANSNTTPATNGAYQIVRTTRTAPYRTLTAASADLINRNTSSPVGVQLGYLNSDKIPDLVGAEDSTSLLGSFGAAGSNGTTMFGPLTTVATAYPQALFLKVADLNCDGFDDVVLTNYQLMDNDYDRWELWTSDASGKLTLVDQYNKDNDTEGAQTGSIATGDLDGDGYADLIITVFENNDAGTLRIFWGAASK